MKIAFVVGAIVIGILLFAGIGADVSGHTREVAQREADAFTSSMTPRPVARCADRDSDGDGYVSCPLVFPDGRVTALECAGSLSINNGCRIPKLMINQSK